MTARPIKRPAPTAPASIEDQHAQIRTALQHAIAAQTDAEAALDEALAAYASAPTTDAAEAYAAAYAHHIATRDLAMQLRAHEAEIAEALAAHRRWEEDRPRREAEEANVARIRAIEQHPANALTILKVAISRAGVMAQARISDDMLAAGLHKLVRKGTGGEPAWVAIDIEEWRAFAEKHAASVFGHGHEWAIGRLREMAGQIGAGASHAIRPTQANAFTPGYIGLRSGVQS